jgi:hypothetical protein
MLAYILAIAVGLGSFSLYMAAFFLPEVYRKYDFIWSGVGMFYALMLWVCAGRITGGVLVGQIASVGLLGWFGWQTLKLRRSLTPPTQQTPLPDSATTLGEVMQNQSKRFRRTSNQVKLNKPEDLNQVAAEGITLDSIVEQPPDLTADVTGQQTLPNQETDATSS